MPRDTHTQVAALTVALVALITADTTLQLGLDDLIPRLRWWTTRTSV